MATRDGGAPRPLGGLRAAAAFLTPLGAATVPTPGTIGWFPLVGAGIGAAVGALWWLAAHAWPPAVAAGIAVAADLLLTGMLHLDGLCDSADGLLPPVDRARRLEIMATPDVGAFGIGAAVVVLGLRWAALGVLHPAPLLLVALWAASRTWMAVAVRAVPYARPGGGLATAFRLPGRVEAPAAGARSPGGPWVSAWRGVGMVPAVAGVGLVGACVAATAFRAGPTVATVAAVAGGTAAAAAVLWVSWRRIGGFTGDVLGAAGMIGETVGLIVAAARW